MNDKTPGIVARLRRAWATPSYRLLHVACEIMEHSGHARVAFDRFHEGMRAELTARVLAATGGRVRAGPFTGLAMTSESFWGDGDRAAFVLGLYESELHPAFEEQIARAPGRVLNIGCAGGLYAVGLACRLPDATVHAFDLDMAAGPFVAALARANGVAERVLFRRGCDAATLAAAIDPAGTFVLVDCEGAELDLVDPLAVPALAACSLIVETHRVDGVSTEAALVARLDPTHDVEIVRQGPRDPHADPILTALPNLEQWLVVNENRAYDQSWLVCRPKGALTPRRPSSAGRAGESPPGS